MSVREIQKTIKPILSKYGVMSAGVFGSTARGEARPDSDVDILVRFRKKPGLVQFIRLENELKQALNAEVDLVVSGNEKKFIKPAIEKDLVKIV